MPGVKYYITKVCTNCFATNDFENNRCSGCGYLFIGAATNLEESQAKKKLEAMKLRGG